MTPTIVLGPTRINGKGGCTLVSKGAVPGGNNLPGARVPGVPLMTKKDLLRFAAMVLFLSATLAHLHADSPAWVARSNENADILLKAIGTFSPEEVTARGLTGYETGVADLAPGKSERARAQLGGARDTLKANLAAETDPQVREDLEIMIHACDLRIEGSELNDRLLLSYTDVGQLIFQGEFQLLQDQVAPERRLLALGRLRKYVGLEAGSTSAVELSKALFEESLKDAKRLGPFRGEVEQNLSNTARYVGGIRKLFAKYAIPGAGAALDALDAQMKGYDDWVRKDVLPRARDDFRLPAEIYAHNLSNYGLGIPPAELIRKAEFEYSETQNELKALAAVVAQERGFKDADYRAVIRELKKEQLTTAQIEPYYHEVIAKIEEAVRRERIIALPERPLVMRLASEAETAAQPAPHYQPPPIVNNTGERGQFILPLGNLGTDANPSTTYDDFTFRAAAWTLSAHEGRPGHDLQFTAMVERGVSLARSIFAFNSVNVEGWALYAEAEFKPYEPPEGQLIALQLRLLRAARAILDPMLNLGMISRGRAHDILIGDVVISEAFATEELDRFTFRSPGQATAYFYGYSKLMELRASAEIALGPKFDRYAFNNFIIGEGLLPPELLAEAVDKEFLPAQK
jgi:Bacterial protein of unknown function (DUF885)